jgi:predicted DNA-binding protein with PD1-like motif
MQFGVDGAVIVVKLSNNDDVFEKYKEIIQKNNIRSGIILSGIGMLKDFELGYFDPGGYKTRTFSEPHELVSMSGSIAYAQNDNTNLLLHIHCSVANREHQVFGGHLNKATVNVVNEITILRLNELNLNRIKNEKTGLMELNIETTYTY